MSNQELDAPGMKTPVWQPMIFAAMAGGMAWGIRGQYGHETGAMIAGLLVSLVLVFLLCPRADARSVVRAVAWGTVGMGFGGTMTYGQTVGLTHDGALIGNFAPLGWGMLGLALKGGVWIGFGGCFLGLGLGGVRYRPRDMLILMFVILGGYMLGVRIFNSPFYPNRGMLPLLYFSDHWRWEPGELTPRREAWGGLWLGLLAAMFYLGKIRGDRLAPKLALWGILGGALGFPLGQSIQAYHAWNPELFTGGIWDDIGAVNWWNMMETTFGAIMGATLGLGLWLNRRLIQPVAAAPEDRISHGTEALLLVVHVSLLVMVEFMAIRHVDILYDLGLIMGVIPVVAIAAGGSWPYLQILPITLIPIAGKTLRQLGYREPDGIGPWLGWIVYVIVPLTIAIVVAGAFADRAERGLAARTFTRWTLLLATWIYFSLNFAFFHFPWPWAPMAEWTSRTPNGIIFTFCALGLTAIALLKRSPKSLS